MMPGLADLIVSVLVPVYNEGDSIEFFLNSLLRQNYARAFEVLLIDGMSEDGTKDKIRDFLNSKVAAAKCEGNTETGVALSFSVGVIRFEVIDNPKRTVPCGLNIGIKRAKGDYILRMDAHTEYDPEYIKNCVEGLEENRADNVGGPTKSVPGSDTLIARGIALASSNVFGVGNSKFRISDWPQYVDTVPFGAWPKDIFEKIGLFDERLTRGQDIEFNSRIRKIGGKIYLNPEIKSYYHCHSTLLDLWRKNFANGQWNMYTRAITNNALSWRHFVPFVFVFFLISSFVMYVFDSSAINHSPFALIFGSYMLLSISFSLKISLRKGFKYFLLLPLVFATLHFSYGIGSFWGLITFPKWLKENKI